MQRIKFFVSMASLLLGALLLTGCSSEVKPIFVSTDITGAEFGKDFKLTDHTGKLRTLADFKGKVVVLFFGYTHCPDVCPTTMGELAGAMKKLGKDAERVQVLFITIDPERDTPALLAQYVPAFHPTFLGLSGDAQATKTVASEFKIIYQKQAGKTPEQYTMDHSTGTYVFDTAGRLRLYVSYGKGAEVFARDIAELLKTSG